MAQGEWAFAIWSPSADHVALRIGCQDVGMDRDADGTWRIISSAQSGDPYGFIVDGVWVPDPAARRQVGDVHAASVLTPQRVVPATWPGRPWHEASIIEIHLGTFTREGTLRSAAQRLPELAELGLTFVELMPIAQFSGNFGWGYDGVLPYAVHPAYGTPDDLADFVTAAHQAGLGVILDVIYNHFGPDGAYLHQACPAFFDAARHTPWGAGFDFHQLPVREYFLQNAAMWVREFGIDGLRLDAVHAIHDDSDPHILAELAQRIESLDMGRPIHLIAEDERNLPHLIDDGLTACWNDDYHHAVHCHTTGESEGYYAPFAVDPIADLVLALERGQVEEGQARPGSEERRGAPAGHLPVTAFVNANETHDQVGNRAQGDRLLSLIGPEAKCVLHALLLTAPYVPMLFMGEEIGTRRPFQFFADFSGELAENVRKGRAQEFASFAGFGQTVPDPVSPQTRDASRPYEDPPPDAAEWSELTRRLLAHRAQHIAPLIATGRQTAEVVRTGSASIRACWTFAAGTIETQVHLGKCGSDPGDWSDADVVIGAPDRPWAFMTRVRRT